jgi:hypothetical protein
MIVDKRGFDVMEGSSFPSWSGQADGIVKDSINESFVHGEFRWLRLRSPDHDGSGAMLNRDGEMVEIGRRLAPGRRITLAGPRMEFADARMQAAGLLSTAGGRKDEGGMLVIDPSPSLLGFSARRVAARVEGFEMAAVFVAGLGFPQIEDLFQRLCGIHYRLHAQTWAFACDGRLRWLVVSRVSAAAMATGQHSLAEMLALFERCRIAADTAPLGEMLVYLGAGADGEALGIFRDGGDIHVVGETYESTDIAQTFYAGRAVHYRPMRPSLIAGYGSGRFSGFYLPCVNLQPGDLSVAIQHARSALAPGGAFIVGFKSHDAGEHLLSAIGEDSAFRNVHAFQGECPLAISATRI